MLKALDVAGPVYGFELWLDAVPEPKRRALKSKGALPLSPFQPLSRDFAFIVDEARPAGDLVRAALGADKALVAGALVFDVYRGPGVPEGAKSVAIEVTLQPSDRTLTDTDIDQVSARIVAAVEKSCGGRLRA